MKRKKKFFWETLRNVAFEGPSEVALRNCKGPRAFLLQWKKEKCPSFPPASKFLKNCNFFSQNSSFEIIFVPDWAGPLANSSIFIVGTLIKLNTFPSAERLFAGKVSIFCRWHSASAHLKKIQVIIEKNRLQPFISAPLETTVKIYLVKFWGGRRLIRFCGSCRTDCFTNFLLQCRFENDRLPHI